MNLFTCSSLFVPRSREHNRLSGYVHVQNNYNTSFEFLLRESSELVMTPTDNDYDEPVGLSIFYEYVYGNFVGLSHKFSGTIGVT